MSSALPILIVEDQKRVAKALALLLDLHELPSVVATTPEEALRIVESRRIGVVLQDMNFTPGAASGEEGATLFRRLRELDGELPVLLLTAWATVEHAVRLIREGAADYLEKPWDDDKLIERIRELLAERRDETADPHGPQGPGLARQHDLTGLVYASSELQDLVTLALKIARADVPVLITGPNGCGKECLADLVQQNSRRRGKPYIKVNVGALPDSLLEAELFGAEVGAFTGASQRRLGRFEAAAGGTLLLDEIGNLSASGQAKLLRVLQTGEFERLGSSTTRCVDVRILAATNVDLSASIASGEFREDLYFRLNVIELAVPPLAERPADVLPLAEHFMRALTPEGQGPLRLSESSRRELLSYSWPGNVRELRNRVQRAVLVATGRELRNADLGLDTAETPPISKSKTPSASSPPLMVHDQSEQTRIEAALVDAHGVISKAAAALGLSRQSLYRRMQKLGIVLERRPRGGVGPGST